MRIVALKLCVASVLLAGSLEAQTEVVERYRYQGTSLATVVTEAVRHVAQQIAERTLPAGATPREQRARTIALQQVKDQAARLVKYQVLQGPKEVLGGRVFVTIRAEVDTGAIRRLYDAALSGANSKPNFRILLLVSEQKRFINGVRERSDDSKIAATIADELRKAGWTVINATELEVIRKRQVDFSRLDGETAKLVQTLAAERGADIVVHGHAKAEGPLVKTVAHTGGRVYHIWKADCTLHAVWADTAEEWFSVPAATEKRGEEVGGTAGAEEALIACGRVAARGFMSRIATIPMPDVVYLEVRRARFRQRRVLRRWLRQISGVESVADLGGRSKAGLKFEVHTTMRPADLADALLDAADADKDADFGLDIDQAYARSVIAKVIPR